MGTALMKSSIVEDGSSKWTRQRSPVVAFEATKLSLFATMMQSTLGNVSFQAPHIRVVAQKLGLEHTNASTSNLHADGSSMHAGSGVSTHAILDVSLTSPWARTGGRLRLGKQEEIALQFQCLHPGIALVELVLTPQPAFQPCRPVSVFMRKVCGGVHKHGLQVGSYPRGNDVVKDGVVLGNLPKVGLLEHSSHFFIQYPSFEDGDPQLKPEPRVHCVSKGSVNAPSPVKALVTGSSGAKSQQLNVTYACKRSGGADCRLDLGLRFWNPVVLQWRKSCGGPRPDAVIESDLPSFSDVFSVGRAAPAWAQAEPAVELPHEQSFAGFIIRSKTNASADPEPLTLGRPIISVSNPKVVDVALLANTVLLGHVLHDSDFVTVTAQHICKAKGAAVVHVKVPFLPHLANGTSLLSADSDLLNQFDAAEFSYKKHCDPGHSYASFVVAFCGALLFVVGFIGTTGFALSKSRQLNHDAGRRNVAVIYGAASGLGEGQEQPQQQNVMHSELANAADHA
eukprot:gnl/MRDRNA2_/MRDRNA2_171493_c0_seq1.p1 gnl/MRDRNA2_/MRDRNA2_171493_c0~~gnl/MRDRNA2_/MRDRNA2_171493_c0_seq1.p1  ORF type:complete len:524 (+),score=84.87 gnl/MRDRNA2_/MRDRNA2_171493_c0_seq1:44-1573(+)